MQIGHAGQRPLVLLGSGPAAVVLALELHRLGHAPTIISRARRFEAVEGLSQRAVEGLRFARCYRALATLSPEVRRVASWNGEHFSGNRERVVSRRRFDQALLADARNAGIEVLQGHVLGSADGKHDIRFRADGGEQHQLSAEVVIDARGRDVGRRGEWLRGPRTVSVGRYWKLPSPSAPCTAITSFENGWAWLACHDPRLAFVQIFLTIGQQGRPKRDDLGKLYQTVVRSLAPFSATLHGARTVGRAHLRDAGTALFTRAVGTSYARVGDAALSIDPLAGHGLYQAISSALALAPVVNTMLSKPGNAELARSFYLEKLQHDFWRLARIGRDFYRQEERLAHTAFWCERQAWPDDAPAHEPADSWLPRVESRPVSVHGFIEQQEVFVTADHPRGVWRIADVPLVELHKLCRHTSDSGRSPIDQAVSYFDRPKDAVVTALQWLRLRGILPHLQA